LWEKAGQAVYRAVGFEPAISVAAAATCLVVLRAWIRLCRLPTGSPLINCSEGVEVRAIGLDVHGDFCEVALAEDGEVVSGGRIETTPAALEFSAGSLGRDDRVALEVSGNAFEIARVPSEARLPQARHPLTLAARRTRGPHKRRRSWRPLSRSDAAGHG
jgi:hypothetical protein